MINRYGMFLIIVKHFIPFSNQNIKFIYLSIYLNWCLLVQGVYTMYKSARL